MRRDRSGRRHAGRSGLQDEDARGARGSACQACGGELQGALRMHGTGRPRLSCLHKQDAVHRGRLPPERALAPRLRLGRGNRWKAGEPRELKHGDHDIDEAGKSRLKAADAAVNGCPADLLPPRRDPEPDS